MLSEKLLEVIGVDTFASENGYRRRKIRCSVPRTAFSDELLAGDIKWKMTAAHRRPHSYTIA
jgi:hypothetical protein